MGEGNNTNSVGDWVALTMEEAQRHSLYGVGGWLIAIAGWLVFAVAVTGYQLFTSFVGQARLIESILSLVCLYTLAAKSPEFPLALGGLAVFVLLTWAALVGFEYDSAGETGWFLLSMAMPVFGIAALGYALFSKRVNITYRLRAKPSWLPKPTGGSDV